MTSKVAPSHLTRIGEVDKLYRMLDDHKEIVKFAFGPISPGGSSAPHVKIVEETGALRLQVAGHTAVQILRVYTTDRAATITAIRNAAEELGLSGREKNTSPRV